MGLPKRKISIKSSAQRAHWIRSFLPPKPLGFVILVVVLVGCSGALIYYSIPFTRIETVNSELPFKTEVVDEATIELGQQQTRNNGENGTKETTYRVKRTLDGEEKTRTVSTERTVKSPVAKIIANGTKKFQFMWCSNGGYLYYTNEQFMNSKTGYTHQSPDDCTKKGYGHMSNLADAAPVQTAPTIQRNYSPTYTTPTYTTPTYTTPKTCHTQYNTYGGYFDPTATTTCY